jgi:2'-hydroxyisoflavone reductase
MQRRTFIKSSLYAATLPAMARGLPLFAETPPKRILVLGGTLFVGPAIVEAALGDGHTVTLFNRGVTNPELFPYVEKLRGYRSANLDNQNMSALAHRDWDVVIDVWPNDPDIVQSAAQLLKDRTTHYLYVSSIAAYDSKDFSKPGVSEDASLAPWDGTARPYSRGKAESERRLHAIIGEKLTIVRPGPIKGVRDDGLDMLIWLRRLRNDRSVIAPGDGTSPVEIVDVKDVANFLLFAIDRSLYGTFNLTGRPVSFQAFLDGCKSATHSKSELVWIPEAFLRKQGLDQPHWSTNFPLWFSPSQPGDQNLFRVSSQKAFDAGWKTRPFENTAGDALIYTALQKPYIFRDSEDLDNVVFRDPLETAKQEQVLRLWRENAR